MKVDICKTLENIKENCEQKYRQHGRCQDCAFCGDQGQCELIRLTLLLDRLPYGWNIDKIKEALD